MVNSISEYDLYSYKCAVQEQKEKQHRKAMLGFVLATTASGIVTKALPSFSNPFIRQMKKEIKLDQNHIYRDCFDRAVENSNLREKGLWIRNVGAFMNLNKFSDKPISNDVYAGLNAYYSPSTKSITINNEKASILGFHELGHAKNNLNSKIGRLLQKSRKPGYTIAGLMGTVALFSRKKPKGEKRNVFEFIQDHCAKIAFIAMLPTVAEEALASHNGIKFAKQAGMSKEGIKNLKSLYGKALLSYLGYALVTAVATYAASKITEVFTRPQKRE